MKTYELFAPRRANHRRTWTVFVLILLVLFVFGGQLIALLPPIATGWIDPDSGMPWPQLTYLLVAAFGLSAVILAVWIWLFERRPLSTIGLNGKGLGRFVRGYLIGLAFLAGVVGLVFAAGGYVIEAPGSLAFATLIPVAAVFAGFIVQGSSEEIFFRGWLMQLLASRHGLIIAVAVNSVLFALFHAANMEPGRELYAGLANILLFGLFTSLYALKEGSIWGVCGWHAAWNWLLASGFGLNVSGTDAPVTPFIVDLADAPGAPWWLTGGAFGPEASIVTTVVLAAGCLYALAQGTIEDKGVVEH